jgi:hypothetical protein
LLSCRSIDHVGLAEANDFVPGSSACNGLNRELAAMAGPAVKIRVVNDDVLRFEGDVLVLKYAQSLLGVDNEAYQLLSATGIKAELPATGSHLFLQSRKALGCERVLFVGVEPLAAFGYAQIRRFARRAMSVLSSSIQRITRVVMTTHGAEYGLDETEAFESVLAGVIDAIAENDCPADLETLSFVEINRNRAKRLAAVLAELLPEGSIRKGKGSLAGLGTPAKQALGTAGYGSESKPRVFVAMPFAEEMADTFHYGIQGAVNAAGLLAERADLATFAGDVMSWVRDRISSAKLVIADLSSASPNVYLEVGFAWGKGVPTVLLVKNVAELKFDVRGQRCLVYSTILELEQKLTHELAALLATPAA